MEALLRLARERDRIAGAMNDIVMHRIISAGLALETALGLLDGRRGAAGQVRVAIGKLDLAIQEFRNVLFDHHQPFSPPAARRASPFRARSGARRPLLMPVPLHGVSRVPEAG